MACSIQEQLYFPPVEGLTVRGQLRSGNRPTSAENAAIDGRVLSIPTATIDPYLTFNEMTEDPGYFVERQNPAL
jgi:hypothetical protein